MHAVVVCGWGARLYLHTPAIRPLNLLVKTHYSPLPACFPARLTACLQASLAGKELEGARAEVQSIRQQQEAERARVKKAIAEMKRKMDGCVAAPLLHQPLLYHAIPPPSPAAGRIRSAPGSCSRTVG